jgi:hypothetical protein
MYLMYLMLYPFATTVCTLQTAKVVAAWSSLRAITFVSARCASLQLTSIAPTHAAGASVAISSSGRRCGRLRSSPLAALRSNSYPSPLLAPLARRLRSHRLPIRMTGRTVVRPYIASSDRGEAYLLSILYYLFTW